MNVPEVRVENRFHNPYRHWVRGLFAEILILGLYMALLGLIGALVAWIR